MKKTMCKTISHAKDERTALERGIGCFWFIIVKTIIFERQDQLKTQFWNELNYKNRALT